ncbi:MAG: arsenic efflux protein [Candidatus Omnitrophica bacterium]|nr:arsenic efflux protein [Candidatus Omnitrophota bacterium]
MGILIDNLKHALMIAVFVFVMMMLVDYLNVLTKGKANRAIKGGLFRQYFVASFLGSTPGCLGAFMNVSFYVHGLISFGAIIGGMIATSGDEAFVMLAMMPKKALLLFGILFILGIIFAYISDKVAAFFKIKPCKECSLSIIHPQEECRSLNFKEVINRLKKMSFVRFLLIVFLVTAFYGFVAGIIGPREWNWIRITLISLTLVATFIIFTVPDHYLEEHIWQHIIKKHLWRVFLWTFGTLVVVNIGLRFWNLEAFVKAHMFWVLLIAGLVGIIPESGPHLLFVTMFVQGLIPFSVLLASSIVQDGHGMLPLLSYSIKDSLLIKVFNLVIGLGIGFVLLWIGY